MAKFKKFLLISKVTILHRVYSLYQAILAENFHFSYEDKSPAPGGLQKDQWGFSGERFLQTLR